MKLQIRVDGNGFISDVKFKTFGCGSAIASSSYMTERVKGLSLEEAGKIKNTEIARELALPPVKLHCSSAYITPSLLLTLLTTSQCWPRMPFSLLSRTTDQSGLSLRKLSKRALLISRRAVPLPTWQHPRLQASCSAILWPSRFA
jgi:NifU-like N terminal domain